MRRFAEAERGFRDVLRVQPDHIGALNLLGILLIASQRFAEAETHIRRAIALNPNSDASFYNHGIALKNLGRPIEALEAFTRATAINPEVAAAWNNRGTVHNDLGRFHEALADFDRAIAIDPKSTDAYCNKGRSFAGLQDPAAALQCYDRALQLKPDSADAWLGRGAVFASLSDYEAALQAFDRTLQIRSDFPEAWCGRGETLLALGRLTEALDAFDRALAVRPAAVEAQLGRANVLYGLYRHDEALSAYERALALDPHLPGGLVGRGSILLLRGEIAPALAAFDAALRSGPEIAEALTGRGQALFRLTRYEEALAAFTRASELKPGLAEAWFGRANTLNILRRYAEAVADYDRALTLKADLDGAAGARLHAKMNICAWGSFDADCERVLAGIRREGMVVSPFILLTLPASPDDQLRGAKRYVETLGAFAPLWQGEKRPHERIRVAYLSSDLHQHHPVAHAAAGLFENHDRSRFETTAISSGPADDSALGRRLRQAFDSFVDAAQFTDQQVAEAIHQREIDIVIDLNGLTDGGRLAALLRRPAPIQVSFLGFAGTSGASCFDYLLADRRVVRDGEERHYSEKVACLPDSFFVTDRERRIGERTPTRREAGLPETGFVFCCFNNSYKINPPVFDIWMRILHGAEGSVLWLSAMNEAAKDNLRHEAQARGIAPERLIFAPRLEQNADHLARLRLADLFLDTLPYNAHATASDALWVGLPVLTRRGDTFAGRVASSLLSAAGLSELITSSATDYEALALRIARDASMRSSLKTRLSQNRERCALFDTARFTRCLETACITMWERHQRGESPASFAVPADE